jgi:hypothetical protein
MAAGLGKGGLNSGAMAAAAAASSAAGAAAQGEAKVGDKDASVVADKLPSGEAGVAQPGKSPGLKRGRRRSHNFAELQPGRFACLYCPQVFARSSNVKRHIATVHDGRQDYQCSVCRRMFGQKASLTRHLRKMKGLKNHFSCPNAGCNFSKELEIDVLHHGAIARRAAPRRAPPLAHSRPSQSQCARRPEATSLPRPASLAAQ